jgi:hypothetical protein
VRYRRAVDDFNEAVFNPADDIFAFGLICYEIITGGPPYAELDNENVKLLFSQGAFPKTKDSRPDYKLSREDPFCLVWYFNSSNHEHPFLRPVYRD